jgi:hypothetical protein
MIKKFKQFVNEEISGTELVGPVGPAYGETGIQNKTVTGHDTDVVFCDITNNFYTIDEYNNLYGEYLKNGGEPMYGFTKDNIHKIISFLDNK